MSVAASAAGCGEGGGGKGGMEPDLGPSSLPSPPFWWKRFYSLAYLKSSQHCLIPLVKWVDEQLQARAVAAYRWELRAVRSEPGINQTLLCTELLQIGLMTLFPTSSAKVASAEHKIGITTAGRWPEAAVMGMVTGTACGDISSLLFLVFSLMQPHCETVLCLQFREI